MKVIFMGTPEFAGPTLESIIKSDHKVVSVFTQAPKPKGRGLGIVKSYIHEMAEKNNIEVHCPQTLKSDDSYDLIKSIQADIIVVAAYGFILPKKILECKKFGCINLHPSRLPRFRGAAPLQHTIISRDAESSICVIKMDEGMDTGDIILRKDFYLPERPSLKWLHDYTAKEGAQMVVDVLNNLTNIKLTPQNDNGACLAPKLKKEDSKINWQDDAFDIDAKIRGYAPWPGSYFSTNIGDIKILEATPLKTNRANVAGKIIDINSLVIACGINSIMLDKIIAPSGKKLSAKEFANGISGRDFYVIL